VSLKTRLDASMKQLRTRVSQRLPMDNTWLIRLRAAFNIGEFMLAHPRDPLSNSIGVRRAPGFRRLHIFFRHVHTRHNGRSRDPDKLRPEWFSHEHCFTTLLTTLEQSPLADRVSLTVVYDGSEAEFATDFVSEAIRKPSKVQLGVKLVKGGSNIKSWLELLSHLEHGDIPDDDVLFLMENDYLHVEGWLDKVAELFESEHQFDYLTLYDHTDYYEVDGKPRFPAYKGLKSNLYVTKTHHWREAPSTCGTFLVPKRVFLEDLEVWSSRLSDFYVFTYLLAVKRRVLLCPIPALSTHCMAGHLAPTIDWSRR
jgi:hypothetical protein